MWTIAVQAVALRAITLGTIAIIAARPLMFGLGGRALAA